MKVTNARQSRKQNAVYDRLARHYDRFMQPLERKLLARLRVEVFSRISECARVLEIGAGTGANFAIYPSQAQLTVASELSGQMLLHARIRIRDDDLPQTIKLIQADAEALPFADDSFDACVATLVFCSIPCPQKAFAELRRVVRAGGLVCLLEHVRPAGWLGYFFDTLNLLTVPLFEDHFNRRTSQAAEQSGLRIEQLDKHARGIIEVIVCRNNKEMGEATNDEARQRAS